MWLLTGDHGGFVKYWQSNMNNVKMYEAHKEPIRGLRWATLSRNSSRQLTVWISVAIVVLPVFVELLVFGVLKIIPEQLHFSLVQISVQDFLEILLYVLFNLTLGNRVIVLDGYLLFVTGFPYHANSELSNVLVCLLAGFRLNKLFMMPRRLIKNCYLTIPVQNRKIKILASRIQLTVPIADTYQ